MKLKTPKILIVEDERIIAEATKHIIERFGYQVIGIAKSGERAIEIIQQQHVDLVLMDIILHGKMNGIEAGTIIQKFDIPIIFITANANDKNLHAVKFTDAYNLLVKPYNKVDLKAAIEITLYKHSMQLQVKNSEKKYRTLIESLKEGIGIIDHNYCFFYANHELSKIIGLPEEKLIGSNLLKFLPERYQLKLRGIFENKHNSDEAFEISIPIISSGQNKFFKLKITHFLEKLETNKWFVIFNDITDLKITQTVLEEKVFERTNELNKLNSQLSKILEETVQGLSRTVEIRDPYTAGHQRKVSSLSTEIAKALNLTNFQIESVKFAGLVHDIGNMKIPIEILHRPRKLNKAELALIKIHPKIGYDLLKNIHFPWPVADIVLQHHEKINGSGYPNALEFDDILKEARIISVADTIEAISSHRPYRGSLGIDKALDFVNAKKGILYDPEIVDCALLLFKSNKYTFSDV
ncbi:MAG: response regulator [Candidatus Cloacimonetes bacterium]|nr:response regulator [Candidatus Cloacimonadota bacterium]